MATARSSILFGRRQQPSSNEECISANCKKITGLLIAPLIVLFLDAYTIYNFSSFSNTALQVYAVFHMVKAFILIIFCALFVYTVYHPEKRDIFWVVGIISVLLVIIGFGYFVYINNQCNSMDRCYECLNEGTQKCYSEKCPDYSPSISKQCGSSLMFPFFGLFAMIGVTFSAFIGYAISGL